MNNKVYLGKLGKTVGLNGDLKIYLDTDFPKAIKKGSKFLTNKKLTLEVQKIDTKKGIVKFISYDTIDDSKKLTNLELYATIEDTKESCSLKQGEFFWFDIIDCRVYENDLLLGIVKDIHRFPLNDYLEVETNHILVEKNLPKVFLIPYIQNDYILFVDTSLKAIKTQKAYQILENS